MQRLFCGWRFGLPDGPKSVLNIPLVNIFDLEFAKSGQDVQPKGRIPPASLSIAFKSTFDGFECLWSDLSEG